MVRNETHYRNAIALRRTGSSYNEILRKVPVAKSTISLWLRSVGLSSQSKRILTDKKRQAAVRGGEARRNERVRQQNEIYSACKNDVGVPTSRERWLVGVALYWAEGSKEKENRPGSGVRFANSDPLMIDTFVRWLQNSVDVAAKDIAYDIYIHDEAYSRQDEICKYWRNFVGLQSISFGRVYMKKGNPKTLRKNRGNAYYGLVRIRVQESSRLTRKLAGWAMAIGKN